MISPPLEAVSWRRRRGLLLTVMIGVTVLQRFAIPGTGGIVGVGYALGVAATLLGLGRSTLRIDPSRLVLYALAVSGLLLTLLFKSASFSLSSFLMLIVMYAPFIAVMPVTVDEYERGLNVFQIIMAVLAWAGLAQMAVQFVTGPDWTFPLDQVLPDQFFISNFNLRIPITEGTAYLKSNGLVLLEPSVFSQFLALSIVIELLYFKRLRRLGILCAAYVTSFSGTGMVLLGAMALPLILQSRRYSLLLLIGLFMACLPLLRDVAPFSFFLERQSEFGNARSSGFMRFFGPYLFISDILSTNPGQLLFGYGPGSVGEVARADYEVLDSSWFKLLVEYGLIGTISFLPFYIYVLFARSTNRLLSFACLIQFLFLGGFLNSFYVQFLYLCLVVWPVVGERQERWPAWSVVRNLGRKRQDDMEVAGRQQGGFALGPQRGPADQRT
jgi:hypothetical protein